MTAIYIGGGVSTGYLNLVVMIMLCIHRSFPKRKFLVYIFAQLLGAYVGSLVAHGIYRTAYSIV